MPNNTVVSFSLKDAKSLIERLLPVQKLSVEASKESSTQQKQTLAGLGGYWNGRKPLILVKACILGALLPVSKDIKRDLEIFEMLMGMDDAAFIMRLNESPKDLLAKLDNQYSDAFSISDKNVVRWKTNVAPKEKQSYSNKFTRKA